MYKNPLEAYEKVNKATMSGRDVEAAVLTKAALKLKACQDDWDAEDRAAKLDDALRFNQKVWSVFQGELAEKDNPLPIQIKENLFRLGAFVDRRIFETMSFPSPEKLTAVININHNIAAGLRGSGA
ncbi:MAG: flagellar biosynthesis regulator FlaF [Desulfatiglans sp.]|nr:flagellar biosynthesis regulator FlaF [Thermodesulfobacteriota bacterium]MEE4351421.1 flagellar biosynthesis regulator FlaF [Desulfatiglans sp.]